MPTARNAVAPAPPDPRIVDECRAFLSVPGRTLEDAYAVGFTPAEVDAAVMGGVAQLPKPQPGPQTDFLNATADIVIYGGSAGGGKSYGLLLDCAAHVKTSGYTCVIFRRNSKQIMSAGGLWEKASSLYPAIGGTSRQTDNSWRFEAGKGASVIQFAHLEHEDSKTSWDGAELAYIGFDELQHLSETQFFYLMSRNRSTCGVRPRMRGTCNPAPNWLRRFLAPWVDKNYPNPAASGEVRYFVRIDGVINWVDKDFRDDEGMSPKSMTFIRSTIYDNKILLAADPGYLSSLKAMHENEKRRLLYGDWDVLEGAFFSEWSETNHAPVPPFEKGKQPKNWRYFGGLDWGYGSPFAFVLCATDERGRTHVLDERYARQLTTREQAADVLECLNEWGVDRRQCLIAADPRMFSKAKRADLIGEADIEAFHRASLQCVEANDNREHGWGRVRDWLQATDSDGSMLLWVWSGYCSHLIEQFPLMTYSQVKPNDMDTDGDDHLHDALRYALMTRPKPSGPEPAVTTAQSSIQQYLVGHKRVGRGGYA